MKRLILLVALVALVTALATSPFAVSDTSLTDVSIPDSEITTRQTEAGNPSAGAGIAIMMYAAGEE